MTERVALIAGAGTELGQELARRLAATGWRVALNDLLPTRIQPLAQKIRTAGGQAAAHSADLTRKLALQTMLQAILEAWGRVDALVFIASVQPPGSLLDLDEWDWHRALDATLTAGFLSTQSVGRVMRELGGGAILHISESSGESAVFAAAAAGLQALSAAATTELAAHNIRVHWLESAAADEAIALLS